MGALVVSAREAGVGVDEVCRKSLRLGHWVAFHSSRWLGCVAVIVDKRSAFRELEAGHKIQEVRQMAKSA